MTRSSSKIDSEEMERLINKVCASFVSKLEEKIDNKLSSLDSKFASLCDSLKQLDQIVTTNNGSIASLKAQLDSFEQKNKLNSVRFCGLNVKKNDNIPEQVVSFIKNSLKIQCCVKDLDFAFVIENGKGTEARPTVLTRFLSNIMKTQVITNKKLLKGTGVSVYEDLTRSRYQLLDAAKQKHGANSAWSAGGKIYYWDSKNNKKVRISSIDCL